MQKELSGLWPRNRFTWRRHTEGAGGPSLASVWNRCDSARRRVASFPARGWPSTCCGASPSLPLCAPRRRLRRAAAHSGATAAMAEAHRLTAHIRNASNARPAAAQRRALPRPLATCRTRLASNGANRITAPSTAVRARASRVPSAARKRRRRAAPTTKSHAHQILPNEMMASLEAASPTAKRSLRWRIAADATARRADSAALRGQAPKRAARTQKLLGRR